MESENSPASFSPQNHYHIRWSDSKLDWCAFPTEDKAKTVAKGLARPGESYAIEQYDVSCERCKEFKSKGMVKNTLSNLLPESPITDEPQVVLRRTLFSDSGHSSRG